MGANALFSKVKMNSGLVCDPYELNSKIGKIVSVPGLTGSRHIGRLIALDPVSSSVVLIVSSFNNTEDSETEENLVKSSDDPTTKSEKRPTDNNSKNNSETIKKEIVVLPWIDLTKLSVVTKNWEKIDLATADQDKIIREKLLSNSTASCFNEKNCSGASAAAAE